MKTKAVILAAILAVAASAPASAKSQNTNKVLRQSHAQLNSPVAVSAPASLGVYIGGREIGRDPDANIRASIGNEYYDVQGH